MSAPTRRRADQQARRLRQLDDALDAIWMAWSSATTAAVVIFVLNAISPNPTTAVQAVFVAAGLLAGGALFAVLWRAR